MKIKKIAGNNKGVTLVLVIVILAAVAVIANILIETAFQNYKMGKASGHTDYSYYAAESAIQKCCDILNAKCGSPGLADTLGISYNGDDGNFAKAVADQLAIYVEQLSLGGSFSDFDVNGNSSNTADIAIELEYLGFDRNESVNPGKIKIEVGLTACSDYVVKPFLSGDKRVYAKEWLLVTIPSGFELRGPVYAIGDLMADHAGVDISGDVHVYGTSPEYLKSPSQYYYGGILAISNSELIIRGNAYSRSFIRTGLYSSPGGDGSRIYVYRDAVAQGLHIFGKGQRIAVLRNAYTFDDLEVNGEDSVLAVNGSYFGLSDGSDGIYHDNSSAIVNSATLHHFNSPASQKSRIVINGAVMVNGGTFRIDDGGNTLYQIEDASLAWLIDPFNPSPVYKNAPVPLGGSYSTYVEWLKDNGYFNSSIVRGFCNLFQLYNPAAAWNHEDPAEMDGSDTAYSRLDAWLADIDMKRQHGDYNIDTPGDLINPADSGSIPDKIQGFCNYVFAANDRMFFMEKGNGNEGISQIKKASLLADSFVMDNIDAPAPLSDWSDYWNPFVNDSSLWDGANGYCLEIPVKISELKQKLLAQTSPFIERLVTDNDIRSGTDAVEHKSLNIFGKLENSLRGLITSNLSNPYIIDASDDDFDGDHIINLSDPLYAYNNIAVNPWAEDKYFLVVNTEPSLELVLDGTVFNGIIFTSGKVILKNGAVVNGAIIAAGKGYVNDPSAGYIGGSAADTEIIDGIPMMTHIPQIKEYGSSSDTNIDSLNNGGYAALYCTGTNVKINFPDPDPETGRKMLLDAFLNQDNPINLYSIF